MLFRNWVSLGIFYVGQLLVRQDDGSLRFVLFEELRDRFSLGEFERFRFYQLRSAIPPSWRRFLSSEVINVELATSFFRFPPEPRLLKSVTGDIVPLSGLKSKAFYRLQVERLYQQPTCAARWRQDLGIEDILSFFKRLASLNLTPFYLSFQFRIFHRLIPTRHYLFRRRLLESPLCPFGCEEDDSLSHFFFLCAKVRPLWASLEDRLRRLGFEIEFSETSALLGSLDFSKSLSTLTIWLRYYIFKARLKEDELSFAAFIGFSRSLFRVFHSIAFCQNKLDPFLVAWRPLLPLLVPEREESSES